MLLELFQVLIFIRDLLDLFQKFLDLNILERQILLYVRLHEILSLWNISSVAAIWSCTLISGWFKHHDWLL
jgi:hypothetical protein